MIWLLLSYFIINIVLKRRKAKRESRGLEGDIDNETRKREEAVIMAKIERVFEKIQRIVAIFWRVIAGIVIAPICAIAVAILATIFDIAFGKDASIFLFEKIDFLGEFFNNYGATATTFSLVIALIPLLYIAYLAIVLLAKAKHYHWVLWSALILWVATISTAIICNRELIWPKENAKTKRNFSNFIDKERGESMRIKIEPISESIKADSAQN